MTEWKFENALDRITAAANPRQLERVPRGALFDVELTYAVETNDRTVLTQDLARVFEACALLESDALGGHGSRGYGKIVFRDVTLSERRFRGEGGPSVAVASIEQPSDPIRAVVADLSLD
jgi:CRISPR-associated protein Csm3